MCFFYASFFGCILMRILTCWVLRGFCVFCNFWISNILVLGGANIPLFKNEYRPCQKRISPFSKTNTPLFKNEYPPFRACQVELKMRISPCFWVYTQKQEDIRFQNTRCFDEFCLFSWISLFSFGVYSPKQLDIRQKWLVANNSPRRRLWCL